MNYISRKYVLLMIFFIITLSQIFPQGFKKENYPQAYLNPILQQNTTKLKQISLLNHFTNFLNPQKVTAHDTPHFIDSIITYGVTGSKGKRTFTYDGKGKITSILYLYLQNNVWGNSSQRTHSYDSSGNLLNTLYLDWKNGSHWENDFYDMFSYDSIGNNTQRLIFLWENNKWENLLRISKIYDSTANLITTTTEKWSDSTWIYSTKITLNYYPNGMSDFTIVELWNGSNWINDLLLTFKYTDDWMLRLHLYRIWDGSNWNYDSKTTFTYSLIEPQLIGLKEVWDDSQWIVDTRYSYSYNSKGYFTHGIYELWEYGNWVPYDWGIIRIENPDGFIHHLWTYQGFVYYYSPTKVEAEGDIILKDFHLSQNYPNPFNPTTTISYAIPQTANVTLNVYDVLGNEIATLVNEEKPSGSYEIEFSTGLIHQTLSSGIYFYRLQAGDFVDTKKMLLLK